MVAGCGGENSSTDQEPFSTPAARAALKSFFTARAAVSFCSYLLPHAEKQIVGSLREEHGVEAKDCATVVSRADDQEDLLSSNLSREERSDLREEVDLDRQERSAAFLDEFRSGVVMAHRGGRWAVAGIATGG